MIDILSVIEEVLHCEFKEQQKGDCYELIEPKEKDYPTSKLKKEGKVLVYSFDREGIRMFPFFQDKRPLKKSCDYIFFYPYKGKLWLFSCELKSNKPLSAFPQLSISNIFVKYLLEMVKSYCIEHKIILNPTNILHKIEYRNLILSTKTMNKTSTNPRNRSFNLNKKTQLKYLNLKVGKDILLHKLCY